MSTALDQYEVCPCCGDFVFPYRFNYDAGFCEKCAPIKRQQLSNFLTVNANHIEHYILRGYDLPSACGAVLKETRPTCLVCGNKIKGGRRNSVFCRKRKACRNKSRRYVYLYEEKHL